MKFLKNPWIRWALILLFFGFVYILSRILIIDYPGIKPVLLREKILAFGIWAPVAFIVFYVLRPLVLFPAGLLSAVGGIIFGRFFGTIYVVLGGLLSAIVEFYIARYFGRGAIAKFLKGKMLNVDKVIEKRGFVTVLLIRVIPNVAYDIQNCSLGLTRIKFRDYFFATLLGFIPGAFAYVYFGSSMLEILTDRKHLWKILIVVLIFAFIYLMQKYLRKKQGYRISEVVE